MINLSFDELRLIAQIRNISDYENKSKEDLIKALSEPKPKTSKPETKPKPDTKPKQQTLKPEPETPKIRVKTNKRKLRKLRKDFDELRHKFSKKKIDRYRKAFYVSKNKKCLFESEQQKTNKNLNELEKGLRFKKFHGYIDSVDYDDLDNYDDNYDFADDDEHRKIGGIRILFKDFDRDYYKPIRTDSGFAGRNNNYIAIAIAKKTITTKNNNKNNNNSNNNSNSKEKNISSSNINSKT